MDGLRLRWFDGHQWQVHELAEVYTLNPSTGMWEEEIDDGDESSDEAS